MTCKGRGAVPVVFLAGGDDAGTRWDPLIAALGPKCLPAFSIDQASLQVSPAHVHCRREIATTLVSVLKQAHINRRVLVVGHSIGGLNALVFGSSYPKKLAGAVLLDPSVAAFFQATHAEPILQSYNYDPAAIFEQIDAVKKWPAVPLMILSRDSAKVIADGESTARTNRSGRTG